MQYRARVGGWKTSVDCSTGPNTSAPLTCMAGFFSLRYRPQPVIVPPVPTPPTRMSTCPPVPVQISGPVVR